jgi:two-component system cell cycle sensor histidine kinase/response regulator CckA
VRYGLSLGSSTDRDSRPRASAVETSERYLDNLRLALDSSSIATLCVDTRRGRYLFVNRAYSRMTGYEVEELLESDPYQVWLAVTHADDIEPERQAIERVAAGENDGFSLEKRVLHKNGSSQWVRAELTAARDPGGRLDTIVVHLTPLDAERAARATRERLETQLIQAQKLGALGRLAGGVAHDFNNRLLIIMGHTELLKRALPEDSALLHHADLVLGSAERAAELTRQLLAYSRRQVLKPEAFDLNLTVDRMRRMLERLIGDEVELLTVLGAKHAVYSDPGQIEQVILNLVLNARDAMPDGGRLTLETGDVSIPTPTDKLSPGEYVVLKVSDTGTGISPDVLPRIFEPFFTTKEVGKGTGLGLSMVEGIATQSGGATTVDSAEGRGTVFTVHLPRAREAPVERPRPTPTSLDERPSFETVLVCDDDDGVRHLLSNILQFRGYTILEARNGKDALEVARRHQKPIHMLVTDLVMPEIGGLALARELSALYPELRVLFVSGYTEDASLLSAELRSYSYFLPKPFLPGELTRMVCAILEQPPFDRALLEG